jgi:hypothetical protein
LSQVRGIFGLRWQSAAATALLRDQPALFISKAASRSACRHSPKSQNQRFTLKSGLQLKPVMALLQVKTDALRTLAAGCPGKTK